MRFFFAYTAFRTLSGGEQTLGLALVGDGGLEVVVLQLTVLASALHLLLHLGNLRLQLRDALAVLVDGRRQIGDLRAHLVDIAGLELLRAGVVVQPADAEVLVLDVVSLLLHERSNHVVDRRVNLGENVEAHTGRKSHELRVAVLLRRLQQERRCRVTLRHLLNLHEVERRRGHRRWTGWRAPRCTPGSPPAEHAASPPTAGPSAGTSASSSSGTSGPHPASCACPPSPASLARASHQCSPIPRPWCPSGPRRP